MKITDTIDGVDIDTDKMSDKEAEIYAAMDNFYKVCAKYDATAFASIIFNAKSCAGMRYITKNEARRKDDFTFLMERIDVFLNETTNGSVRIGVKPPTEAA